MRLLKSSIVSIMVASLLGCSSISDSDENNRTKLYTQAELDLLLTKAKSEERLRIQRELNKQDAQKNVFREILARQNQTSLFPKASESSKPDQVDVVQYEPIETSIQKIEKIIPLNRKPVLYKEIDGKRYYRCAANSLKPILAKDNVWVYEPKSLELSATLCKMNRDKQVMTALQEKLYELKLLKSDTLTKEQLVDGVWGSTTLEAVKVYQQQNGLLFGQMTIETLKHIGVFPVEETLPKDSMMAMNITKSQANELSKKQEVLANDIENEMLKGSELQNDDIENQKKQNTQRSNEIDSYQNEPVNIVKGELKDETKNDVTLSKVDTASLEKTQQEVVEDVVESVDEKTELLTTDKLENSETRLENPQVKTAQVIQKQASKKAIQKIIPKNRSQYLYKVVGGAKYYRCAANSFVAQSNEEGGWIYDPKQEELSATLCKRSRDFATMTDLQYELHEKGFLVSDTLTKDQLLSGKWDSATLDAVKKYQKANGLLYGQLTIETLEHIGVFMADEDRIVTNTASLEVEQSKQQDKTNDKIALQIEADSKKKETENIQVKKQPTEQVAAAVLNTDKVTFKPFTVFKQDDSSIDYAVYVPNTSKNMLYGKINGQPLWSCRARAEIATKSPDGNVVYDGTKSFRATLCKMSRSVEIIKQLQIALKEKGYLKPSPPLDLVVIDGIWGINTLSALREYQRDNGLAYGQVTIETFEHLGVFK